MAKSVDATRIALFGALAVVAAILGVTLSILVFGAPPNTGSSDGEALIGGPFELVDQDGKPVDESILEGQLNLVYFGYTFCPDFCPTELANMAEAKKRFQAKGQDVRIVFISIDPERDTAEVMKEYVPYFDEDAIGLTGTPEQVKAAARAYKVYYAKADDADFPDGYAMDHSTFVYAMDADGRFITYFTAATDPDLIVETVLDKTRDGRLTGAADQTS